VVERTKHDNIYIRERACIEMVRGFDFELFFVLSLALPLFMSLDDFVTFPSSR
jgi:hypothetical protein